jgi:hypothetical protein
MGVEWGKGGGLFSPSGEAQDTRCHSCITLLRVPTVQAEAWALQWKKGQEV